MGCCGDSAPALVSRSPAWAFRQMAQGDELARDRAITNALIFGLVLFGILLFLGVL